MNKGRILIVENEIVSATYIESCVTKLGYEVFAVVSSGEEAISKVKDGWPDLILMDIKLNGEIDGIETVKILKDMNDVPVIYLTADKKFKTIERAKNTDPFGYLVKPFTLDELFRTIEIALYKYKMEHRLKENEKRLSITLNSIGDGMICTDKNGYIKIINPAASILTGYDQQQANGKHLDDIYTVISMYDDKLDVKDRRDYNKMVSCCINQKNVNDICLISKDKKKIYVSETVSMIKNDKGQEEGAVIVFSDITEKFLLQKQLETNMEEARAFQEKLIPKDTPKIPGIDIIAKYLPAIKVGGDLYDFYIIDNKLVIILADVCGHGVPAAMMTSYIKAHIKYLITSNKIVKPAKILNDIKSIVSNEELFQGKFLTMFVACIDVRTLSMEYANAGHCIPYLYRNSDIIDISKNDMLIINGLKDDEYKNYYLQLERNDKLFLYTDGMYEWKMYSEENKILGINKFREYLLKNSFSSEKIEEFINGAREKNRIEDDASYILLSFNG